MLELYCKQCELITEYIELVSENKIDLGDCSTHYLTSSYKCCLCNIDLNTEDLIEQNYYSYLKAKNDALMYF